MTEENAAPEGGAEEVVLREPEAPKWSPEDEESARFLGWKSPDEWKGDAPPAGLIENPRDYIARAESILPFRKLQEKYKALEGTVERIDRVYAAQLQRQREQHEENIKALRAKQREAAEVGDTEAFDRAREAEDKLREQAQPEKKEPPKLDPAIREAIDNWRVDNDWFGADEAKTKAAMAAWAEAEQRGITTPSAILRFVDSKVGAQPKRQQPMFEDGLALGGGGGSVDAFSKLPKEAKDAFGKMVKQGLFPDTKEGRAAYVKDYEG